MARGLWKAAISFGLVNDPVELHSAHAAPAARRSKGTRHA